MDKEQIIIQTEKFMQNKLQGESSGHNWWHVYRVLEKFCQKSWIFDAFTISDCDVPKSKILRTSKIVDFRRQSISAKNKMLIYS
jgi:hypothetical protein